MHREIRIHLQLLAARLPALARRHQAPVPAHTLCSDVAGLPLVTDFCDNSVHQTVRACQDCRAQHDVIAAMRTMCHLMAHSIPASEDLLRIAGQA